MNFKIFFSLFLLLLIFLSCKKDKSIGVPAPPTDFTINLNLPDYSPLQIPGNWIYVNGGSRGIIIYRLGANDFVALDRHCTFNVQDRCRIVVDTVATTAARDHDCCGSLFSIVDGTPVEGSATLPLFRYNTTYNGAALLRIYN